MDALKLYLPACESQHLDADEKYSLEDILAQLNNMEVASETHAWMSTKEVLTFTQCIRRHLGLKYCLEISVRQRLINVLMKIYMDQPLALSVRTDVLILIESRFCKKSAPHLIDFSYSWKPFWNTLMSAVNRANTLDTHACETVEFSHLKQNVAFLHNSRHYIKHDITCSNLGEIVDTAMKLMEDTRHLRCVEGLILLIDCLPTNYSKYDEILPLWIKKWDLFHNNRFWDLCWLTLLCRARKHTKTFDWVALGPYLIDKLRQHLKLPSDLVSAMKSDKKFPFAFPKYYTCLVADNTDNIRDKVAKLLYTLVSLNPVYVPGELCSTTPAIDTMPGNLNGYRVVLLSGFNCLPSEHVSKSAVDIVMFLQTVRHFFHPGGAEVCSQQLMHFVTCLLKEVIKQLSGVYSDNLLAGGTPDFKPPHNASTLHIPTVQYLYGSLLLFIFESLYSKHKYTYTHSKAALNNLISIEPRVGDIAVPFLLSALDPSAVNQSHQAPIALTTLSLCLKSLLYPVPVVLKHLPDILRLSLPGIDTSDSIKTFYTLDLYCSIFEWIPISAVVPPVNTSQPFLTSLSGAFAYTSQEPQDYAAQWVALNNYVTTEWIVDVWERLFALLDAQEKQLEGTQINTNMELVGRVSLTIFKALSVTTDASLRHRLESRVLDYILASTLTNAVKGCAKIVEHMVSTNRAIFSQVIARVLSSDVVTGTCSHEKMTYRLHLASNACRQAGGENIRGVMSLLEPLLTAAALQQHAEKSVRKACGKLLRSVLRGLSALYPAHQSRGHSVTVGEPCEISKMVVWHLPTSDDLVAAVHVLQLTATRSMEDINSLLSSVGTSSEGAAALNPKKVEDALSNSLHVILRALRGAADVLGDGGFTSSDLHFSTARKTILEELHHDKPSTAEFLKNLRWNLLQFLNKFQSYLSSILDTSLFYSLYNSVRLHSQWGELSVYLLSVRRVTRESLDSYLVAEKALNRTWFAKFVHRRLKKQAELEENKDKDDTMSAKVKVCTGAASPDFWYHLSAKPNMFLLEARKEFSKRAHRLSIVAVEACFLADSSASNPLRTLLEHATRLCRHKYNRIHSDAVDVFQTIFSYFQWSGVPLIPSLIAPLTLSTTTSDDFEGYLQIIKSGGVLEHIVLDWSLTQLFLNAIIVCQSTIDKIAEPRKRAGVISVLVHVYVKYLVMWNHAPLQEDKNSSVVGAIQTVLNQLGLQESDALLVDNASTSEVTDDSGSPKEDGVERMVVSGFRFEALAGFILLHYMTHPNVTLTTAMWRWAVHQVRTKHGHPAQQLGLSALTRLSEHVRIHGMQTMDATAVKGLLSVADPVIWKDLLHGISRCRMRNGGSVFGQHDFSGYGNIVTSSDFFKKVVNRHLTTSFSVDTLFSSFFSRENMFLVYSLAVTGLLDSVEGGTLFSVESLSVLLSCAKDLPSDGQEKEKLANNATAAELFGGLLRAYYELCDNGKLTLTVEVQQVFLKVLNDHFEKTSDYHNAWFAAIYYAHCGRVNSLSEVIPKHLIDSLNKLLSDQLTSLDTSATRGDDSFNEQVKVIAGARAIMQADLTAAAGGFRSSEVADRVLVILCDANTSCVFHYKTVRIEVSLLCMALVRQFPSWKMAELGPVLDKYTAIADAAVAISEQATPVIITPIDGSGGSSPVTSELDSQQVDDAVEMTSVEEDDQTTSGPLLESASETAVATPSDDSSANKTPRNAIYTLMYELEFLLKNVPQHLYCSRLAEKLSVVIRSVSFGDAEFLKTVQTSCVLASKFVHFDLEGCGVLSSLLSSVRPLSTHSAWRVRKMALILVAIPMANNWYFLTNDQRKICRDVLTENLSDPRPEISQIAMSGMVTYLLHKTGPELAALAEVYIRNSEALANRTTKKRKLDAALCSPATDTLLTPPPAKPDSFYTNTIHMMCCLLLTTPYDLPLYVPALVTTLARHLTTRSVNTLIVKTVQTFRMSHQDRWESDFKARFTHDQLDALQGVGSGSYFT